ALPTTTSSRRASTVRSTRRPTASSGMNSRRVCGLARGSWGTSGRVTRWVSSSSTLTVMRTCVGARPVGSSMVSSSEGTVLWHPAAIPNARSRKGRASSERLRVRNGELLGRIEDGELQGGAHGGDAAVSPTARGSGPPPTWPATRLARQAPASGSSPAGAPPNAPQTCEQRKRPGSSAGSVDGHRVPFGLQSPAPQQWVPEGQPPPQTPLLQVAHVAGLQDWPLLMSLLTHAPWALQLEALHWVLLPHAVPTGFWV